LARSRRGRRDQVREIWRLRREWCTARDLLLEWSLMKRNTKVRNLSLTSETVRSFAGAPIEGDALAAVAGGMPPPSRHTCSYGAPSQCGFSCGGCSGACG